MRGSSTYLRNNSLWLLAAILFAAVAGFFGCAGTGETKEKESVTLKEFLAASEKEFDPSQYDKNVEVVKKEASGKSTDDGASKHRKETVSDTVSGFRVQVFFSQDIEAATQLRDTLSWYFPTEYVYIVYDLPYYKVRMGNFLERPAANALQRKLASGGYRDAWVVPDRVITNLPLKPEESVMPAQDGKQ